MKVKVKIAQWCLTLCDPMKYSPWDSPEKNTRVGSQSLLQGIFPTQGSNPGVPHCRWVLYQLSHQGSPIRRAESKSLPNRLEILSDTKYLFRYLWLTHYHRIYFNLLISEVKVSAWNAGDLVRSLGEEDPLEKAIATYSSTLAWRIPWKEEPGRLHSIGSQRVGHDWVTSLHFLIYLQCFSLMVSNLIAIN